MDHLKKKYDQPKVVYRDHVHKLCKQKAMSYTCQSLLNTLSLLTVHVNGLERHKGNTLKQFLTAQAMLSMTDEVRCKWNEPLPPALDHQTLTLSGPFSKKRQTLWASAPCMEERRWAIFSASVRPCSLSSKGLNVCQKSRHSRISPEKVGSFTFNDDPLGWML